jgi:hypothetical protein
MSSPTLVGFLLKETRVIQTNQYLQEESISVATEPKRQKELDNKDGNHVLTESIEAVYYQEYKMTSRSRCQGNDNKKQELILDESHFGYTI